MEILRGIAVSPGIAIAEAVVLDAEEYRIPGRSISVEEIGNEEARLSEAIQASVAEIRLQKDQIEQYLGRDAADIFSWHIGVLETPQLQKQITELINKHHYSAAYATSNVMRQYQRRFMQMKDPLLVERVRDVQDIERRLLRNILGETREDLAHITEPVILIAHDMSPSQTAQLSRTNVVGVALDMGGATSHTAILLHSLGRPAVIGVTDLASRVSGGDLVVIDGVNDIVVIEPDEKTLEQYRAQERKFIRIRDELANLRDMPAVTTDGVRIYLDSNIEFPGETEVCLEKGADGIGLYRTEFLFLRGGGEPSEEEQYEAYREAILGAKGRPVTIRTFDLGADKYTQDQTLEREPNPMLGLRSIRYSLKKLNMFKAQLRAILRAGTAGPIKLMFPLLISLMELRQAKMVLHDAMEDLEEERIDFGRDVEVGIMVETPAAAIQCRDFAKEVSFVSIGTNDLVQYTLAVDRGNERVSRFYTAGHPAVLRSIHDVIKACTRAKIGCSLCGEMAGQPLYTMLLGGLGLRRFSMAPHNIPEVKKLVRMCSIKQMERVAKRTLTFETERQVANYLRSQTRKLLPDDPIG